MTRGAIRKLADRMETKGLVARAEIATGGRDQILSLTPSGRALVPVLAGLADANDAENFSVLTPSEHETLALTMPASSGNIAAAFDASEVERLVLWAQVNPADYSYAAFFEKAKTAGCAGYLASFLGRRAVYYGRTAETHVEHFPR